MSRRNRRGLGGGGHEEIHDEDEILNAIENGQVEGAEEGIAPTPDEDIAGDTSEDIIPDAEGDGEGDFNVLDALNGKADETPSPIKDRIEKEERPPRPPRNEAVETEKDITFADTERFGAGITLDIKNNNKNNGGNRMSRVTKLSAIIAGKMPQVQNGRSLANFRGLNYILEPQDILKFIGESITEYNPEAKLAMD